MKKFLSLLFIMLFCIFTKDVNVRADGGHFKCKKCMMYFPFDGVITKDYQARDRAFNHILDSHRECRFNPNDGFYRVDNVPGGCNII